MREAVGLLLLAAATLVSMLPRIARGEDGEPRLLYFPVQQTSPAKSDPAKPRIVKRIKILFFTAKWCGFCPAEKAKLVAYLKTSATPWEIDETEYAHCQIVDADRRPDLVRKYNVTGLPTIMLVDDGKEVKRGPMMDVFQAYGELTKRESKR